MELDLFDHLFHQVAMFLEGLQYCLSKNYLDLVFQHLNLLSPSLKQQLVGWNYEPMKKQTHSCQSSYGWKMNLS